MKRIIDTAEIVNLFAPIERQTVAIISEAVNKTNKINKFLAINYNNSIPSALLTCTISLQLRLSWRDIVIASRRQP